MAERGSGMDMGIAYQRRGPWGMAFAELLRDATRESRGTEGRVGYRYELHVGSRLTVRPQIALAVRDAKLNNYYYGVRLSEATVTRPAFEPGAGTNAQIYLDASFRLSGRRRLFGGVNATRWSAGVAANPIVERRTQTAAFAGLALFWHLQRARQRQRRLALHLLLP